MIAANRCSSDIKQDRIYAAETSSAGMRDSDISRQVRDVYKCYYDIEGLMTGAWQEHGRPWSCGRRRPVLLL